MTLQIQETGAEVRANKQGVSLHPEQAGWWAESWTGSLQAWEPFSYSALNPLCVFPLLKAAHGLGRESSWEESQGPDRNFPAGRDLEFI